LAGYEDKNHRVAGSTIGAQFEGRSLIDSEKGTKELFQDQICKSLSDEIN
jgi:hypothetical protein